MASRNGFCRQKVNAKCPQISDEKKRVLSLWVITFDRLKKEKMQAGKINKIGIKRSDAKIQQTKIAVTKI